jgi:predicted nucleic acid-binding Zn ribbon protein
MSRQPTRQLTLEFVLRTLARLRMVTRLDQTDLAQALAGHRKDVQFLGEYLEGVASEMKRLGYISNRHPNGDCVECGHEIGVDHNGARFCSSRCRQRAYRKRSRLIRPLEQKNRNEPAICDASYSAGDKSNVTHDDG